MADTTNPATNTDTATPGGAPADNGRSAEPAGDATDTGAASAPQDADSEGGMSVEDYKAALAKARREAAKYRTERNALKPLADKAREAEEAGKTELERAEERIAALEAEKRASEQAAIRARLAADAGVPVELIGGDDEEQMTASAQALKAFIDKRVSEAGGPKLPAVGAVGRDGDGHTDKDTMARRILGLNTTM